MAIIETGTSTPGAANVDAQFNLMTNTPGFTSAGVTRGGGPENAGAIGIYSVNDEGTTTLTRRVSSPQTSQDRRFRVGVDTLLFNDTFNATTQNSSVWDYIAATLTASQPGSGTVNFSTSQGTLVNHGAFMRTYQFFPIIGSAPLVVEFAFGLFNATLVANEEWYCGLGRPTVGGTIVTDGVYLKLTTAGLVGAMRYNNSEISTASLATLASFTIGTQFNFRIVIGETLVEFWRDGILLGTLATPVADSQPVIMSSLPIFMQKLNTGTVSNTNTIRVGDVFAFQQDLNTMKEWATQLALLGQGGNLGQNGHTQGKTTIYANSTAPTAVALTNTTAAFTGLGGQAAVLPTLAVSSDGIIFSYQNPTPNINLTGRNLLIYGVSIDSYVSVVLAGGPLAYGYTLAYGHTAVSLATLESASFAVATTHAPRIVPIGFETYPLNAAAATKATGVQVGGLNKTFRVPLVVRPGEFVAICAKAGVGSTVTTTGAINFTAAFDAVWE